MSKAPYGAYISTATADGTKWVHIDHETIEFAALNARIRHRLAEQNKKATAQRDAARKTARRTHRRMKRTAVLPAACVLSWVAAAAGLASPILAAIVSIPCYGSLCFRAGKYK